MYSVKVKDFNIQQIADSGQCFRINKINKNTYSIVAFRRYIEVKQEQNTLIFSCSKEEYKKVWENYFDLNAYYGGFIMDTFKECPSVTEDKFLLNAIKYSSGIRILRQEFFEMLISFIISQRKSIPAIKTCIEKLCQKYGEPIRGFGIDDKPKYAYAFPNPEDLIKVSIEELKECSVGYRAEYIKCASEWWLYDASFWDWDLVGSCYDMTIKLLMNDIKGVGVKVANCICLFGLHQLEACPIDVWMQKVINEDYNGEIPDWMQNKYAGLLQQYIFYYKRMINKNGE